MTVMALTEEKREQLATEIFNWLIEHEMWVDVSIYFNGKFLVRNVFEKRYKNQSTKNRKDI